MAAGTLKQKMTEHILSVLVVSGILILALLFFKAASVKVENAKHADIKLFLDCDFIEYNDPFNRALLLDVMNIYYPGQFDKNEKLVEEILQYRERSLQESMQSKYVEEKLSSEKLVQLLGMYIKFLIVYIIVMFLTYYGVQTFGTWQFVRKKRRSVQFAETGRLSASQIILRFFSTVGKAIAYMVLFSPAYVIAYSIRTEFNTDTIFFMVLLGVVSNGLLIMYTNKFYTFLIAESRKGYIETALVKNLNNSYSSKGAQGIPLRAILKPIKRFEGHVFGHIYKNAQFQYLATIKEQASFLITGLIIIEMALNIHGHLSYEMLRQILYKNYDIVIVIILSIFYTVKLTEIATDWIMQRQSMKYENR